jgi:hypothetical protein
MLRNYLKETVLDITLFVTRALGQPNKRHQRLCESHNCPDCTKNGPETREKGIQYQKEKYYFKQIYNIESHKIVF